MRGNGLRAESYRLIADVDPPTAEELLVVFREHGIAAYATRADSDGDDPDGGEPRGEPDGPNDDVGTLRFYADAERAEQAAELLDGRHQGRPDERPSGIAELDEDAAWSRIIAAYDEEPSDPVPRWPVSEDADPEDRRDGPDHNDWASNNDVADQGDEAGSVATRWPSRGTGGDDLPPMRTTEETERFVPPTPPPLPRLDPVTKAAWIAVLGAPALFVLAVALQITLPTWLAGVVAVGFVGGIIALFLRLKSGPPDDTDDGAVV